MDNEKRNLVKTSSDGTSSNSWLNLLMAKAVVRQQFRNNTYSPTLEQKRLVLEDWSRLAARIGRARFTEGLREAFLHTTFIPSCADIEQWAPQETEHAEIYRPFPELLPPQDKVTPEQVDKFNALVKKISAGVSMTAKKEPKSEDLPEVVVKGMKAKVIDRKAEAANDK